MNRRGFFATGLALVAAYAGGPARAHEADGESGKPGGHLMQGTRRSVADYKLPSSIKLTRDDGKSVSLAEELDDGRPVMVNFIYTTCTAICPVTSKVFQQVQTKLGPDRTKVHLVSISLDPEEDTPARLTEYAKKYKAGPGWQHYTGTAEASVAAQKAFDVYRGDKMNHTPVTLLRASPGKPWVRFDGFATADNLVAEYRQQVAEK
jgi:protein SCO1